MCLSLARLTAPTLRGTHKWQSRTSPDSKHRVSLTGSLLPKSPFLPAVLSLGDLHPGSVPPSHLWVWPRLSSTCVHLCVPALLQGSLSPWASAPRPVTALSTAGARVLSSPCCPYRSSSGFSGFPLEQQLCPAPCGEGLGCWALSHCGHLSSSVALALWSCASAWTLPRGRGLRRICRLLKSLRCRRMCLLLSPLALSCVTQPVPGGSETARPWRPQRTESPPRRKLLFPGRPWIGVNVVPGSCTVGCSPNALAALCLSPKRSRRPGQLCRSAAVTYRPGGPGAS